MGFVDGLGSIIDFFINQLNSLIWLIQSIPKFMVLISQCFLYAPPFVSTFLNLGLAIMIIFAVIKLIP